MTVETPLHGMPERGDHKGYDQRCQQDVRYENDEIEDTSPVMQGVGNGADLRVVNIRIERTVMIRAPMMIIPATTSVLRISRRFIAAEGSQRVCGEQQIMTDLPASVDSPGTSGDHCPKRIPEYVVGTGGRVSFKGTPARDLHG